MGLFDSWRNPKGRRAPSRSAGTRLHLEQLESRLVPYALTGNAWPNPSLLTISFVPDGTIVGTGTSGYIYSNLFATFNAKFGSPSVWETPILKAAQTWAAQTNINFSVVADNGATINSGSYEQGDPGMGDIRISGFNFGGSTLAGCFLPPPGNNASAAGDMQFNTAQNFGINQGYDLYSVTLHEFGHALGLGHSGVSGTVMYPYYSGIKTGLASDDISGARAIYSTGNPRSPDAYETGTPGLPPTGQTNNNSFSSADNITPLIDPTNLTAQITGLDVTTTSDLDYYAFQVPAGTNGTMTVQVQSQGLSLLSPKLTVYAADQVTVLGSASVKGQYGTTLTVTVNGVTAGQQVYVKVGGADTTVFSTGQYALTMGFSSNPLPAVPLPNTQMLNGTAQGTGGSSATSIVYDAAVSTDTAHPAATFAESPQAVAMDANGNYVVTWSAQGADGNGWGVYARPFNADGTPRGDAFLVNTTTAGDQQYSGVAMDPAGDFVVTWSSNASGSWNVFARRYAADGTPRGNEFRVNTVTAGDQKFSSVAMDTAGDFVVTWSSSALGTWDVFARRYAADGTTGGVESAVNTTFAGDQTYSDVTIDANGDFAVTWSGNESGSWNVYARLFGANGTARGGAFQVNPASGKDQMYSTAGMDIGGDFVVTWSSNASGSWNIMAQLYNASGTAVGNPFQVNTYTGNTRWSRVSMGPLGNFLVTWSSLKEDGDGWGIFGQSYDGAGHLRGGEFQVNNTTAGDQQYSSVAMNGNGQAVIVWSGNGPGTSAGVFAQQYAGMDKDMLEAGDWPPATHGSQPPAQGSGHSASPVPGRGAPADLLAASLTLTRSTGDRNDGPAPVSGAAHDSAPALAAGAATGLGPQSAAGSASPGASADACFTDGSWMEDLRLDLLDRPS